MLSRSCAIALAILMLWCGCAFGQENLLPLPLDKTPAAQAIIKAKQEHRVLIVVRKWMRPPFQRRPWWANNSVRAWLAWHGTLVEVKRGDPESADYFRMVPDDDSNRFWGFDVIIDGKYTPLLVKGKPLPPELWADGPDDWDTPNDAHVSPTGTSVLFQINHRFECTSEVSPLWKLMHQQDCPEPLRPGRMYYFGKAADGLPTVDDIKTPSPGDRYIDVLGKLREADAKAAGGDKRAAFALLTWCWERGREVDDGFALAACGLVLPRMQALAAGDKALKDRMFKIAEAELVQYPWYDDDREAQYLCLRAAVDDTDNLVRRFNVENVDADEETMGALASARSGELKESVVILQSADRRDSAKWKDAVRRSKLPLPRAAAPETKVRWETARVKLLTMCAAHYYGELLTSPEPADRERGPGRGRCAQGRGESAAEAACIRAPGTGRRRGFGG
ncbi:MAG: hypothetical protein QM783_05890 [Phycisphaerales bacterium]